jgi:hypothetical protein
MQIVQLEFGNKKHKRDFISLPFNIYADIPQWVPPLDSDARFPLDHDRFPYYRHSQAVFFLAYEGERAIGRLAVLDTRPYNEYNHKQTAFFYLFECQDNLPACRGLFDAATGWARARGLDEMVGPRGFNAMDVGGILVKGFEHRPAFGLNYNPPYYSELLEAVGFEREHDSISGYLSTDYNFPEEIHTLAERICARRGLRIARYKTRKDLRALVPLFKDLYNNSLGETLDNYPITEEEAQVIGQQLIWLADPNLVKVVMKDDEPVGFLLAYPDLSAALQKTRGRLFPFGWLTMLLELRNTEWININGAGLKPEYRGSGGTAILFSEMCKSITENPRYKHADIVQISTDNDKMLREMKNFGIDFYKTHRSFRKKWTLE